MAPVQYHQTETKAPEPVDYPLSPFIPAPSEKDKGGQQLVNEDKGGRQQSVTEDGTGYCNHLCGASSSNEMKNNGLLPR